jgi:uncharacterized membrane protein YidH (DUF202 family)
MDTQGKTFGDPDQKKDSAAKENTSQHLSNERTYLAYVRTAVP